MTESEVAAIVQEFPSLGLRRSETNPRELVVQKGNTLILLDMKGALLVRYQVSWVSGFTKASNGLIHDVCSGLKYVELVFLGHEDIAGAVVWLDNKVLTKLSKEGNFTEIVPLGTHELRIELPGSGAWIKKLHYNEMSSGYDRLPLELLTKQE